MSDGLVRVTLTINTAPSAEIFLTDSQLQLVASAVHRLETRQVPGVYKVKVRQGRATTEQLLLLEADTELTVNAPEIASPVPLGGTRKSHEFHAHVAETFSKKVHWALGSSADSNTSIFLQARYWTGTTKDASAGRSFAPPATALSLRRFDSVEAVDLATVAEPGPDPGWDPSAACTIAVQPGSYVLRAKTSTGATVEQVIHASTGWQTQVFILRQPLQAERRRSSTPVSPNAVANEDMFSLGVTMSRGSYRETSHVHLSELARLALADERPLLTDELTSLLRGKFENPMLGIFGAHLMLLAQLKAEKQTERRQRQSVATASYTRSVPAFDQTLFDHVVSMLRGLLGRTHPDVEALSLRVSRPQDRADQPVVVPPMLRRSWSLLVEASTEDPELVPVDLWKRVARMTPSRPFLVWLANGSSATVDAEVADQVRARLSSVPAERGVTRGGAASMRGEIAPETRRQVIVDLDIPASAVNWVIGKTP